MEWLNNYCLIGMTDKRGHAWHYLKSEQGVEPNHYPGSIPVDDIIRRLFHTRPIEVVPTLTWENEQTWDPETRTASKSAVIKPDTRHKAIVDPITTYVYQYASADYVIHPYDEWLIDNLAAILDTNTDDLVIASALLLESGGVASVQVELPENSVVEGFEYRPYLAAVTSYNSHYATMYRKGTVATVCDNTLSLFMEGAEDDSAAVKVKHTKNSLGKLSAVRDTLRTTLENTAAEMEKQLRQWLDTPVSARQWEAWKQKYFPMPTGDMRTPRTVTNTETVWQELDDLYFHDERSAPWNGTALGVYQAANTYHHHYKTVRGRSRAERNAAQRLNSTVANHDERAMKALMSVLG